MHLIKARIDFVSRENLADSLSRWASIVAYSRTFMQYHDKILHCVRILKKECVLHTKILYMSVYFWIHCAHKRDIFWRQDNLCLVKDFCGLHKQGCSWYNGNSSSEPNKLVERTTLATEAWWHFWRLSSPHIIPHSASPRKEGVSPSRVRWPQPWRARRTRRATKM